MEHHFSVAVAQQVGIEKAILLYNVAYWIRRNVANKQHFYDERTWTYNSAQAFAKLFPYMKPRSIAQRLQELEKDGYLVSSQKYNSTPYDKTKWYSLTEKCCSISKIRQSNSKDRQSDSENRQSIGTDTNPDVNTNTNQDDHQTDVGDEQPQAKGQRPGSKVAAAASGNGELFEKFWDVYPRKIGRKKCRQIWSRLKPSVELAGQIVTAVRAYKRTEQWLKDNGEFVPHPSTFLSQARWEDELPVKPEPQRGDDDWLPTEEEAQQIMRESGLIK